MTDYKMGPFGLLVQRITEDVERKTPSGIIIPGTVNLTRRKGKVIATGNGSMARKMEVKKGDTITYDSVSAIEMEIDDKKFDIVDARQCLFIN